MEREPLRNDRTAADDLDAKVDDLLECYRPGRDDDSDVRFAPLLAELAKNHGLSARLERVSACDRTIQAAFADVAIPPDLLARVMAGLPSSPSEIVPVKVSMATVKAPGESQVRPNRPNKFGPQSLGRRAFLSLAGTAGVAAAIAIGVICLHHPRQDTPSSLLDKGIAQFLRDASGHPQGSLVTENPPPADLPFSKDLLQLRETCWRTLDDFPGGSAIAYDLPAVNGSRATLYVFHGNVPGLLPFAPSAPTGNTGGCSAGAWQVGSTLYVLVVEGDDRAYRRYLDMSHGPIA